LLAGDILTIWLVLDKMVGTLLAEWIGSCIGNAATVLTRWSQPKDDSKKC